MIVNPSNIEQIDFWEAAVLLVDKPYTFSSFQLVYEVKKAIGNQGGKKLKIGHAGTLDPLATGLLILCTGKMTKQIDTFQAQKKTYSGSLVLGASRPTSDMESEINQEWPTDHINPEMIEAARLSLWGQQMMTPPIHSAVKVKGVRAYQLAREGKPVTLNPKPIVIHEFDLNIQDFPTVHFNVSCSKGTYIRSLVTEFGKRLGSAAYLSKLQRDAIGDHQLKDAWTLDELKKILHTLDKR